MHFVVVIFEQLIPISGGGTPRIRSVIDELVNRGHEVSVAASFNLNVNKAREILNCTRVFPLKNVSRLDQNKMIKYMLYHTFNIPKVLVAIMKFKPDIIITHNSLATFSGLLAQKITGCLVIGDITDLLFEYLNSYPQYNSWILYLQKIGRYFEKMVIQKVDIIMTISNAMKEVLIQKGANKNDIKVIYDGVALSLFKLDNFNATILKEKYAEGTDNVVMYHGVIDPQDHPEILAEAAIDVLKRKPKTKFWVVGDGAAIPTIKEKVTNYGIKNNFFFFGWVPYYEVPKLISACDVGLIILPNTSSGKIRITLKSFEYWACEKPIVAAELIALKEIIIPWQTGLFYKPEDHTDLANKICILLDDKKLCKDMGKAGYKLVEKKYNWSKLANKFVSTCENLYVLNS